YVLYAEIVGEEIEVDSEPYGDNFARPARLLPLEAKALVAAIDLFGDHLPQSNLQSARRKIVEALGHDPSHEGLEIVPAGAEVARVWVSPERARWLREERTVVEELADGAVVVELPYAGKPWLVREILRGAGDLVVLEPPDAREAIAKEIDG